MYPLTFEQLDDLKKVDEVSLLELLEVSSEDIVDMFPDKIEENLNKILRYLE